MAAKIDAGTVLGHYRILRLLGEGGMGAVYEAEDQKLGRRVALKILPPELVGHADRRARFEREARAIAALQHPNIVTLHAIEEADGHLFLVMERVEGKPLGQRIPSGGMDLQEFLNLAIPLTEAVAAAHAQGITHRDLKPANVIVDLEGRPRVLDFGLAKAVSVPPEEGSIGATVSLGDDDTLTGEGRILGTVDYMSPEQAEAKTVDHRSDIFSLGVVLYEMATGRRPFAGDTSISVISSILRDDPTPVGEMRQAFPRHAGRIIRRCLQKDPARRYQSAMDLKNDLLDLRDELDSGELAAPQPAAASSRSRWTWVAMLALAGLAVAAVIWAIRGSASQVLGPSKNVVRLTTQGAPFDATISPDGRYIAYAAGGTGPGGIRVLRLLQVGTGSDLELASTSDPDTSIGQVQFSPDGDYVYYTKGDFGSQSALWRVPVLGGEHERMVGGILNGGVVSPEGRWVAAVRGEEFNDPWDTLEIVSGDGEHVRTTVQLDGKEVWDMAWDRDGNSVIIELADIGGPTGTGLYRVDANTGELRELVAPGVFTNPDGICPEPSLDSILVSGLHSSGEGGLWRVEIESGSTNRVHGDYADYDGCDLTRDGSTLVTIRDDVRSRLWTAPVNDPTGLGMVETASGNRDGADSVAWFSNDELVYGAPDAENWQIWQTVVDSGKSRRLTTHGATTPTSGAGRILYWGGWVGGEPPGLFGIDEQGRTRRLSPERVPVDPPGMISPDGEWVFVQQLIDEGMRLIRRGWDGGEPIPVHDGGAHLAHYSPDGNRFNTHILDENGDWKTAIFPADFGPPEALLDNHSELTSPWASNESIYFARTADGVRNIWELDVNTLKERQVTRFTDGVLFSFDVSPDRSTLAFARGENNNELLLIENP